MPTNPVKTTKQLNLINRAVTKSPIKTSSKTTPYSLLPVLLDQVNNLLNSKTWIVGYMAMTKEGDPCSPTSKCASNWCLVGAKKAILASPAWRKYNSGVKSTVSRYFNEAISKESNGWGYGEESVMNFNDSCMNVTEVKKMLATAKKTALSAKTKTK